MFNSTNTTNLTTVPVRSIIGTVPKPGQPSAFLNFLNDNSIGRSMQMRLRLTL
jgi:hypothetical protein